MTDRLAEIEALLATATPGNWTWLNHPVGQPHTDEAFAQELECPSGGVLFHTAAWPVLDADAALIAAAPGHLRWLLDRVKQLEAERKVSAP